MRKEHLEKELEEISKFLEDAKSRGDIDLHKKLQIVHSFILSILKPENFAHNQLEDLSRLAKEIEYGADTEFKEWLHNQLLVV